MFAVGNISYLGAFTGELQEKNHFPEMGSKGPTE